jgi:hypothetical protein
VLAPRDFFVHIGIPLFGIKGILPNKDQNIVTLLKHKGCKKLSFISLASRSKWWLNE